MDRDDASIFALLVRDSTYTKSFSSNWSGGRALGSVPTV